MSGKGDALLVKAENRAQMSIDRYEAMRRAQALQPGAEGGDGAGGGIDLAPAAQAIAEVVEAHQQRLAAEARQQQQQLQEQQQRQQQQQQQQSRSSPPQQQQLLQRLCRGAAHQ